MVFLYMLSIYLDTSVINFLFADDAPEKKEITVDFFNNFIKTRIYQTYISPFVIEEILQTKDENKKESLLKVISDYNIDIIELSDEVLIDDVADLYIDNGVIPEKKRFDALHVAFCVIHHIDYLVSWNYKHLANINRERKIISINLANNYPGTIRIITPLELIDYGT
jgi:predicted nucleic acid-binding protein